MAKNGKLPKRIAGVKIPKKLRKSGGKVQALMQMPIVRNVVADIVAVGLLAAADSIAKKPTVKTAGRKAKHAASDAGQATADAATTSAVTLTTLLAAAAREGARVISATYGSKKR